MPPTTAHPPDRIVTHNKLFCFYFHILNFCISFYLHSNPQSALLLELLTLLLNTTINYCDGCDEAINKEDSEGNEEGESGFEVTVAKETRVTATTVAAMMANGSKDSARPHNNQLRVMRMTTAMATKRMRAARATLMVAMVTMLLRGITVAVMMAKGDKDSASQHSTIINLRRRWEQQEQ